MLSDKDGVILESRSQTGDRAMFDQVGLTPGVVWSVHGTRLVPALVTDG